MSKIAHPYGQFTTPHEYNKNSTDKRGISSAVGDVNSSCLVVKVAITAGRCEVEGVGLVPIHYLIIYAGDCDCLGGVPVSSVEGEGIC